MALSGLVKVASPPPMEGVFPTGGKEPVDLRPIEDDEGNLIERRFERIKRDKKIRRDRRDREELKRKMELKPDPIEEQEEEELKSWYKAISEVGDSVILIPFDSKELEENDQVLQGWGRVFGSYPRNYKEFHQKANMIYGSHKQGDVDVLKSTFPALWADISAILNEKGLSENDVVFMLYNQENSPVERFAGFTRNPFFFGHDMGHNIFDTQDQDWEFKEIINEFISEVYKLYMSEVDEEEGEESVSAYTEIESEEEEDMMKAIDNFFHNPSGPEDSYADVFQVAASGNLDVEVPDGIWNLTGSYVLPPENKAKAEGLKNKVIGRIKSYINSNHQYGTRGSGPLSHLAGSVVLNDI
jgi:hypothetical protein